MEKICLRETGFNKGSITVEAAIVVPIVILSIVAVILMGLVLYQRAVLQSAADKAARAGADTWESLSADIATGKTAAGSLDDSGLYWRLFEADKGEKEAKLKKYAEALLVKRNIITPESSVVLVDIKDFLVYKQLELTIENAYRLPGGGVLRLFGSDGKIRLKVTSFAVVDDPAELIRNTDFILDMEKELENKYPGLKNLGDKTRDIFRKMKDNLDQFMD